MKRYYSNREMDRRGRLNEAFGGRDYPSYDEVEYEAKKRPCCPNGGGHSRYMRLDEKLKAVNPKDQKRLTASEDTIEAVLKDINGVTIGAQEARDAFKKLQAENKKMSKIAKDDKGGRFNVGDVKGVKGALKKLQSADSTLTKDIEKLNKSLSAKVSEALRTGKKSIHENVKINGVRLSEFSVRQLRKIHKQLLESKREISKRIRINLNENMQTKALREKLSKKNALLEYVDQEMTYRIIRRKYELGLNESYRVRFDSDGVLCEDEMENLFGPAQDETGSDSDSDSKDDGESETEGEGESETEGEGESETDGEEDEDVALSRVVITMKSKDAAEKLGELCVENGMSEDDYDIEPEETEDEESEEGESEETEEGESEESEGGETEETEPAGDNGEAHESVYVKKFRKMLFEGFDMEDDEDAPAEGEAEGGSEEEEAPADGDEEGEGSEETPAEEGNYKFVLNNIEKIDVLLDVLDQYYGKSKEEVEKMMGVELVDGEEEEDNEDNEEDGASDENGAEDGEALNPEDIFANI